MNKNDPDPLALLPESMRPAYDPSQDPVLEALRTEALRVLSEPMTLPRLRLVVGLLEHADQIIQLRQGAPTRRTKRRAGGMIGNSSMVDSADWSDGDGVMPYAMAPSPMPETMGTHAFREIVGLVTKALDAMAVRQGGQGAPGGEGPALAAETYVRALTAAQALPEGDRATVTQRLHVALDRVLPADAPSAPDPPPPDHPHPHPHVPVRGFVDVARGELVAVPQVNGTVVS